MHETLIRDRADTPSMQDNDGAVARGRYAPGNGQGAGTKVRIAIASTFTIDLLREPLQFWMRELEIAAGIEVAPYAQLLQELLNPESLLATNSCGFNVMVVRPEDWIRDRSRESEAHNVEHLRAVAGEFREAIARFHLTSGAWTLLYLCPPSSSLLPEYSRVIAELQDGFASQLNQQSRLQCLTHAELIELYPLGDHEDRRSDGLAHIPYTPEYFAALATLVARRIAALLKPRRKVIVLDCDNTLWHGLCAEEGPGGVRLTPAHLQLHEALVRQHDAGTLLCLCSKNSPSDVEAVFKTRADMLLREEHLLCSRVNWESKSANLRSLARQLDLALDSFIFIDDSPAECAEVRATCPQVLTLQLPQSEAEILHFVDHVWAFDHVSTTSDAKQRTLLYRQNLARNSALEQATDLDRFLASLELQVDVTAMQPEQMSRVAELIQRTNQFNLSGIRWRLGELEMLCQSGEIGVLVVHVRDRFGDYGLVGALGFRRGTRTLDLEVFVLSCRVLGRRVEHQIVSQLACIARAEGLLSILLRCAWTARNVPARKFVEESFSQFRVPPDGTTDSAWHLYDVPVPFAERLIHERARSVADTGVSVVEEAPATAPASSGNGWHEAAYRLSHLADIVAVVAQSKRRSLPQPQEVVVPRTPTGATIARVLANVLGREDVGLQDDFFDLGGNSLLAVQAIAGISSALGAELSIYDFFDGPTVEQLATRLAGSSRAAAAIQHRKHSERVRLSCSQQRLWFIDQLEGASDAYHIPLSLRLRGSLDQDALRGALDAIVMRHESLRTIIIKLDGEPMQQIAMHGRFALQVVDLRGSCEAERETSSQREAEATTPFELCGGQLARGRLLRVSDDDHVLLITLHHMIADGWSLGVLVRELGPLYDAHRAGRQESLPPLPIQYADYVQWQWESIESASLRTQLAYWKEHLQGAPALLQLPSDRPRPAIQSYNGDSVHVAVGRELTEELKGLCRRLNLTLAMTLHAALALTLARLSGQNDIVIGMPVANRSRTELEGLVGFFVNTLAIRTQMADDPTVVELLRRVRKTMLDGYANQEAPFEKVVELLQPTRSLSHGPLFQVMFALQNAPQAGLQLSGVRVEEEDLPTRATKFDLVLSLQESNGDIVGNIAYATDLFERATIARWVDCFNLVLQAMVRKSEINVSRLPLLTEQQHMYVLGSFNDTRAAYADHALLHELLEQQVARTPRTTAVTCGGRSLTYEELNSRANQLAGYLRDKGVGPDERVALYVERSLELVVGLLGILKSGGAYVPLDPHYPTERVNYMLRDAAPKVLLTQANLAGRVSTAETCVTLLDRDSNDIARYSTENLDRAPDAGAARRLAYVIYTSGSTGNPKGVMIEHTAVVNFVLSMQRAPGITATDCMLAVTTVSFDIAGLEIFLPLIAGARLVLVSRSVASDGQSLARMLVESGATMMQATPATWDLLIRGGWNGLPGLKALCGGEALSTEMSRQLVTRVDSLWNLYGPTETTIWSALRRIAEADAHGTVEPLGPPIANTQIYVLDPHRQPVPIGVAGEIYIGGVGVARGYLNKPELTQERFIPDPFSADAGARMYRTGDMGRWRTDGTIEYLGRNDHQVKIRGFRIELAEIEAQLLRHAQVAEAVVVTRQSAPGDVRLIAYLAAKDARAAVDSSALRVHLKAVLPEYMIPSTFVMLEHLPRTPNGKLDRRALPAPPVGATVRGGSEAPRGEIEEAVAQIWQGLLNVDRIGRDDNFFELGGHSLLVAQAVARIRSALSLEVPIRLLFEFPTLAEFCRRVMELIHERVVERIEQGGPEIDELLEMATTMPDSQVADLLEKLTTVARP